MTTEQPKVLGLGTSLAVVMTCLTASLVALATIASTVHAAEFGDRMEVGATLLAAATLAVAQGAIAESAAARWRGRLNPGGIVTMACLLSGGVVAGFGVILSRALG